MNTSSVLESVLSSDCVDSWVAKGEVCKGCNWYKNCGVLDHFPDAFADGYVPRFNDICFDCRRTVHKDDPEHKDHRRLSRKEFCSHEPRKRIRKLRL